MRLDLYLSRSLTTNFKLVQLASISDLKLIVFGLQETDWCSLALVSVLQFKSMVQCNITYIVILCHSNIVILVIFKMRL